MSSKLRELFRSRRERSIHPPAAEEEVPTATATARTDTAPLKKGENLGLKLLYQPQNATDAIVDIVFVHGLTGNSFSTWYEEKSRTHWPSALLKQDIPDARVLSFGYDANVASFCGHVSRNRLGEHAANFLGDLVRKREDTDTEDRKIIFVAHSLGGLLVDKTLTLSRSRAEAYLQRIAVSTIGIAYLGTPHSGADLAAWAVVCTKLVKLFKDANSDIVAVLEPDSEVLRNTQDDFGQLLETRRNEGSRINITCFFEEKTMANIGLVVPQRSAILFACNSYGIPADHVGMTRFSSRTDLGYDRVLGELKRWIKPLRSAVEHPPIASSGDSELPELREEYLRTLDYDDKFKGSQTVQPACAGTFEWIWLREELGFRHWLRSGRGIYWITGKPGSGKSTMIKYLTDAHDSLSMELNQGIKDATSPVIGPIIIKHFFYFKASPLARSIEGLIRSLLWQILVDQPSLFGAIFPVFDKIKRFSSVVTWELEHLEYSFWRVLDSLKDVPLYIFIDGLDEYDGEDTVIANYLDKLVKRAPANLRLCLASRPYPDFSFQFRASRGFEMHTQTLQDVHNYVHKRFEEDLPNEVSAYKPLMDTILNKHEGVILWVKLVCDEVQRGSRSFDSPKQLWQRLNTVPENLPDLYQRILDEMRDKEREEARRMIAIVIYAARPLSLREFYDAFRYSEGWEDANSVHVDLSGQSSVSAEAASETELQKLHKFIEGKINAVCRGLLQVQKGSPRLLHETVEAFFRHSSSGPTSQSIIHCLSGDTLLFTACLKYQMSLFKFPQPFKWTIEGGFPQTSVDDLGIHIQLGDVHLSEVSYIERYRKASWDTEENVPLRLSFLQYSIQNWLTHTVKAETETGKVQIALLDKFSGSNFALWRRIYQIHYPEDGKGLPLELLELAIEFRLNSYCKAKLQVALAPGSTDRPHIDSSRRSLCIPPDVGGRLLFAVAKGGNEEIATLLLRNGACLTSNGHLQQGDLHESFHISSIGTERLAEEQRDTVGDPPQVPLPYEQSALHRAVYFENSRIVGLFLQHGGDGELELNQRNLEQWLSCGGHIKIDTLRRPRRYAMLPRPSDTISISRFRDSLSTREPLANQPLGIAVRYDRGESFRVLLNSYREKENYKSLGCALIAAAYLGREQYVQELLQYGVNPSEVMDLPRSHLRLVVEYANSSKPYHSTVPECRRESRAKYPRLQPADLTPDKVEQMGVEAANRKNGMISKAVDDEDPESIQQSARNRHGKTPLHFAAERGHAAIVGMLLEYGADRETRDWDGRTPLCYAEEREHKTIVRMLVEDGVRGV